MDTSKLKTYGIYALIGVVLILGLVGSFVPDARDYIGNLIKLLFSMVGNLT